jgi:hypothetical protein
LLGCCFWIVSRRYLLPVIHDGLSLAVLGESLGHLIHLLLAVLETIDANVADEGDTSTHSGSGTGAGVLDGETLLRLDTELLTGEEVDLGVRLARGRVERGGSRVNLLIGEELVHADLVERGNDTRLSRGRDDSHGVALLLQLDELGSSTGALLALLGQLLGDGTEFLVDVLLKLLGRHLEAVDLLEVDHHATEVLANKLLEELVDGVALALAMLLEKLVGEVGASLEGKTFGEAESVITVEQDVLDLMKRGQKAVRLREVLLTLGMVTVLTVEVCENWCQIVERIEDVLNVITTNVVKQRQWM